MADDIGMDRTQMWNLLPPSGPPGPPAQPKGPPPGYAAAKAPPAGFGPETEAKAMPMPRIDVHGREIFNKGKAKGKGKNKGKGKDKGRDRRRPPLSEEQLGAAKAAGAVNTRPPRWGAGECGACGGWYIPRMHVPGGGSGFCLSPPHWCLRSKVVKEKAAETGRPCHVIHEEYRRAFETGAEPPPPWRDEAAATAWSEVLDAANADETDDQSRAPLVLREAPTHIDDMADASIGSTSFNASIGSSGVTGVELSEDSEPEGVLDYEGEQDRRSRSPSADFEMSAHDKAVHEAKADALDLIADTIRTWAQDMRDAAAGQSKKVVESKFPQDLIESILHSASALRGKHMHMMAEAGKSAEDIQASVALQSSNIMREVALMAKKARKTNFRAEKRDRSPSSPPPRRRRSPPAMPSGSRGIDKPAVPGPATTTKAPPARHRQEMVEAKEPRKSKKDDHRKRDEDKQRRRASDKRQEAQEKRKQAKKTPPPSSPSATPPRVTRKVKRRRSPMTPH